MVFGSREYGNFWELTDEKAISKYVINNLEEVKSRIFKYPNLKLALSGHKHLDYVGKEDHIHIISTVGFVVPQGANGNDHRFRVVKINNGEVSEKLISIL